MMLGGREGGREGGRAGAYLGGDLVLAGLVAAGSDDGGVRLEPGEFEDGLAPGGLGEEDVGGTHGFFGGGADLGRERK